MSDDDLKLLQRIRDVQLEQKARLNADDGFSPDYIPWACWGYAGSYEIAEEYGPFVKEAGGPTADDYAAGTRLMEAGLLDGCMCGCRGDMMVTHDGLRALGVEFDPADVDDGHNPTTVWKNITVTFDGPSLDAWRSTLDA